jgi:alpha-beta hydrolase superfamily lysophospholipase
MPGGRRGTEMYVFSRLLVIAFAVFFGATNAFAASGPGALISVTPMLGAPDGASAYRIVYTSTGLSGDLVPVTGVIIVPAGREPRGGRPIVAWAHPTTGIVSRCAPSLARVFFSSVQGLSAMLARGYIVTATDYPGLGTLEPHPYLVGISEGRAVLDSVRAARQIPGAGAGQGFAVWGHSQGGHAGLFAGILAGQYAPELELVGVAAASPPTDLATLMTDDLGTGGGNNISAMTLWSWSRIYGASMTSVVAPAALPVIARLANECIERWFDVLIRRGPTLALEKKFLTVQDLATVEPWRDLLVENSPRPLPPEIPIFVAQGTADLLVRPSVTAGYVSELCRNGSRVRFDIRRGVGHAFIARDAAEDAISWIADRFAGTPAPDDCRR